MTKTELSLLKFIYQHATEDSKYFFYHGSDDGKEFLNSHSLTAPNFEQMARGLEKEGYLLLNEGGSVRRNVISNKWFISEKGREYLNKNTGGLLISDRAYIQNAIRVGLNTGFQYKEVIESLGIDVNIDKSTREVVADKLFDFVKVGDNEIVGRFLLELSGHFRFKELAGHIYKQGFSEDIEKIANRLLSIHKQQTGDNMSNNTTINVGPNSEINVNSTNTSTTNNITINNNDLEVFDKIKELLVAKANNEALVSLAEVRSAIEANDKPTLFKKLNAFLAIGANIATIAQYLPILKQVVGRYL